MLHSGSRDDTDSKARDPELAPSDTTVLQSSLAMSPDSISAAAEGRLSGGMLGGPGPRDGLGMRPSGD